MPSPVTRYALVTAARSLLPVIIIIIRFMVVTQCLKEIDLVQRLQHRHIIEYIESFIDRDEASGQDTLILVFEFAEAGDLKRQLRKARERNARFDERFVRRVLFDNNAASGVCEGDDPSSPLGLTGLFGSTLRNAPRRCRTCMSRE